MRRDIVTGMLDALTASVIDTPEIRRHLLSQRIQDKQMITSLLTTARFGTDPRRARLARTMLAQQLSTCDGLLIGPNRPDM